MNITPVGNRPTSFFGIRQVAFTVMATANDLKVTSLYAKKSDPLHINFDVFTTKSKKVKQPLYKKVIQYILGKDKLVGTHNQLSDGSYEGVRVFSDGTQFDYATFRYEDKLFGKKMGVKVNVTQKNGYQYTITYCNAYKEDGKVNLPTIKSINDGNKRNYKEFKEKHYPELKNYLIDDIILI